MARRKRSSSQERKRTSAADQASVRLQTVFEGILEALSEAKRLVDLESGRLIDEYRRDPRLASMEVPAFAISDVDIELRFAIVGYHEKRGTKSGELMVAVTSDVLKELEAHQMSLIKVRISPVRLRVLEEETAV